MARYATARIFVVILVMAGVGFFLYQNTLNGPFIFDDKPNIIENPYIRMTAITPGQIAQIKDSPSPRSFANFTFAVNYYFHQYHVAGYHLINILIHIVIMIESSFIGLALIFEHRTYLPSVFPVIAITTLLYKIKTPVFVKISLLTGLFCISSLWTYQRNTIWCDATTLWADCAKKSPEEPRIYSNLATAWSQAGQPQRAVPLYLKALEMDPDDMVIYNNIGRAYGKMGKPEKAISYFQSALHIEPTYQSAHSGLGAAFFEAGQPEKAIDCYKKILATGTPTEEVYINMGVALQATGQIDEAIHYYKQAIKIAPHSQTAYTHIGIAYIKSGRPNKALSYLTTAIQIDPTYQPAYINMGTAMLKTNRPEQAITYYDKAFAIGAATQEALVNMGVALQQTGHIDKAMHYYQSALKSGPYEKAYNNLGNIYFEKKELGKSRQFFQKAIKTSPTYDVARKNLDKLQIIMAANEKKIHTIEQQRQSQPFNPGLLYQLAGRYIAAGHYDKATQTYEALALAMPDNSTIFYNLACLYARQNKPEKAVANLKQAIIKGYNNWSQLKTDTDLENIRETRYFKKLTATIDTPDNRP